MSALLTICNQPEARSVMRDRDMHRKFWLEDCRDHPDGYNGKRTGDIKRGNYRNCH